jgi:putative hydroxymethylpyrimidine transporter CytX
MNKENGNNLSMFNFMALWFGAAISVAEILAGGLLAPLGLKTGIMAIILGHLVGTALLVLGGIIGTEKRIPALLSTRITFGQYGSYLFSALNVLQLIGWTAVMIISGARSVNQISKLLWSFDHITIWGLIIGLFILVWVWLDKDGAWKKLNMVAVILLFLLTVVLSVVIFKNSAGFDFQPAGGMSFGSAFELVIVMPLSWLPLIADYTRFAKSKAGGIWGSFLGYFVGSSWMYIIGLGTALVANDPDPSGVLLAVNLGVLALGIVILATVTTTFLDAYSAGVSFLNIFPKLNEKKVAMVMTGIGTVLALVLNMDSYQNFLYAIGSVFSPLFAILLCDYFLLKNQDLQEKLKVNYGAIAVWALGVGLYYWFINLDLVFGATIPVMVIIAIIHGVTRKGIEKWYYSKEYLKAS